MITTCPMDAPQDMPTAQPIEKYLLVNSIGSVNFRAPMRAVRGFGWGYGTRFSVFVSRGQITLKKGVSGQNVAMSDTGNVSISISTRRGAGLDVGDVLLATFAPAEITLTKVDSDIPAEILKRVQEIKKRQEQKQCGKRKARETREVDEAERRARWLAAQEEKKRKKEAQRKARAEATKAREEEWRKDREAKNAERKAQIAEILEPYQDWSKPVRAYIGERITIRIPSSVCAKNGWRRYTRFAVFVEQGQITLREAGENHEHEEIVLGDNRQLAISVRLAEQAGWCCGDVVEIRYQGKEIVLQKVRK